MHASERAVVFYNPLTGEHRTPARADAPMPEVYAQSGFERREIMNMSAWEKEAGVVHESSNYAAGGPGLDFTQPERTYKPNPEAIKAVAQDIADAVASGPWTGQDRIQDATD